MVRRAVQVTVLLATVCFAAGARLEEFTDFQPQIERTLFDSLNNERAKAGLQELKWNDKLMESARKHAQQMAAVHMLSHQVAGEPVLSNRVAATKLRFNAVAENVAFATEPEDIHPGW